MKLACVVQRYGSEITGGAETHCREYAEHLALKHDVTVLTTCAKNYLTWANAYSPGLELLNGVTVHRFQVDQERSLARFSDISLEVFSTEAPTDRQEEWFRENGPSVPKLLEHLQTEGHHYDLILFFSYRYYQTYFGLPIVSDRAILVPTAEEDPAIFLSVLKNYFNKPAGYIFNTPEEQKLVQETSGAALKHSVIAGFGIRPAVETASNKAFHRLNIPSDYVLCLGRVDHNKGADTLAVLFLEHLHRGGRETTLVFAGPKVLELPKHPRIRTLGLVPSTLRDSLLANARALIIPSFFESLSIVLLEAWNYGVPALVNARCRVLKGQVRRANGGLYYQDQSEFSAALDYLLTNPAEAKVLGKQGMDYVNREYRWPTVMERVESLLVKVWSANQAKPAV